jgi:hypothetical protein
MKYRKLPVEIKIELVTEDERIETLEGSQDIKAGQYLATGIKGEQYAFGQEVFDTYIPVEGKANYFTKSSDVIVEAIQLTHPIEVFRSDWQHKGKAGDFFLNNNGDQYVCDQEVFLKTYEPVE